MPQAVIPPAKGGGVNAVPAAAWEFGFSEGWIRVDRLNFYGTAIHSPNQHWILALADNDGHGRGGFRERGFGQVLAIDRRSGAIVTHLNSVPRPSDGAIANDGTFVVSDAGFGEGLKADVTVYGATGACAYRRRFLANIYNVAIDASGRYIVSQTCHADNPDGNVIEVADVAARTVVFSKHADQGWADGYEFELIDGRLARLWVELKRLGRFAYDDKGRFDVEAFTQAQITRGDITDRIAAARRIMADSPAPEELQCVISSIEAVLTEQGTWHEQWLAEAYRALGEARERRGETREALVAFEAALARNPKIGVKRKAAALRKQIGAGL